MTTPTSTDFSTLPPADQQAIGDTLNSLLSGFSSRNADQLTDVYSADADWVNAFGSVKKGSNEIVAYLRGLFADDNFTAGKVTAPPQTTIRVVSGDVVLVSVHLTIEGQKLLDGGTLDRNNFSLHVLQRQDGGHWLIVSEMYMDANTDQTYLNHS